MQLLKNADEVFEKNNTTQKGPGEDELHAKIGQLTMENDFLSKALGRIMGIEALYRKPNLSKPHPGHRTYPYLLKGMTIGRANQVWATDITYIPLSKGYVYLVAIMDWASRKVLSWRLSNTLDTSFCLDALEEAIERYGCPEIFNSDQGSRSPRRPLLPS